MTWKVKNLGRGPIILNNPDLKIEPGCAVDVDKIASRDVLEKSRSLTIALQKKYLVQIEKTEIERKETITIKDETSNKNNGGLTTDDLGNFKQSVIDEVKKIVGTAVGDIRTAIKTESVVIASNATAVQEGKIQRPQGVKVVDADELALRKGFVSDLANDFNVTKGEFGKTTEKKTDVSSIANELDDILGD